MTAKTTTARLAVWAAIDNWAALNPGGVSVFKRKMTHANDVGTITSQLDAGLGDLVVCEVLPVKTTPVWQTHRMQDVPYAITIRIAGLKLAVLEQIVEDVIRGVYQAADPSTPTVSYVRAATGRLPQGYEVSWAKGGLGNDSKTKAWVATIQLGLVFNTDPYGTT
jgi:hypothetical protein